MSEPVAPLAPVTTVEASPRKVPALRREAVLPREQRGGLGAVALLCSLAGVASGFALATTILATQLAQTETRMTRRQAHGVYAETRERAFLGIQYVNGPGNAARIVRVFNDTPASEVGLAVGDLIVRFDGEMLDHEWELGGLVRRTRIGHEATLEVRRGTTTMVLHPELIGAMLRDQ
jgi:S1-C subfamily serine protease